MIPPTNQTVARESSPHAMVDFDVEYDSILNGRPTLLLGPRREPRVRLFGHGLHPKLSSG